MDERDRQTPVSGVGRARRRTEESIAIAELAVEALEGELTKQLGLSAPQRFQLDKNARDLVRGYIGQALDRGSDMERTRFVNLQIRHEAFRAKLAALLADDGEK